jgi:transposase
MRKKEKKMEDVSPLLRGEAGFMRAPCLPPLILNANLLETLLRLAPQGSLTVAEHRRLRIVLHVIGKTVNFRAFARELDCDRATVDMWFRRFAEANREWEASLALALRSPGHAGDRKREERLARSFLADAPRSGAPTTYTAEQYTRIVAVALEHPKDSGHPITHWTARELAAEIHKRDIARDISSRQIQRFLGQADLKPHRFKYWLNPKIDDPVEFERSVKLICDLYRGAPDLKEQGVRLVSVDEKTGIQALERNAPTRPMIPGHPEQIEFEYSRHGTLCLIPAFDVIDGKVIASYTGKTRTEDDWLAFIKSAVATDPDARWIFVNDNLNTHMSEGLVRWVAALTGFKGDLGVKDKSGILKNCESRKAFLGEASHRVRFVYTPKHCSWLNQVEIWFGILARKVLKRGNFISVDDLDRKIRDFIEYFNRTMAKPFKWVCKGLPLRA